MGVRHSWAANSPASVPPSGPAARADALAASCWIAFERISAALLSDETIAFEDEFPRRSAKTDDAQGVNRTGAANPDRTGIAQYAGIEFLIANGEPLLTNCREFGRKFIFRRLRTG